MHNSYGVLLQKAKRSSITYSADAKTYIDVRLFNLNFTKEDAAGARSSGGVNTLTYVTFWSDPDSFTESRSAQKWLLTWIYLHSCLSAWCRLLTAAGGEMNITLRRGERRLQTSNVRCKPSRLFMMGFVFQAELPQTSTETLQWGRAVLEFHQKTSNKTWKLTICMTHLCRSWGSSYVTDTGRKLKHACVLQGLLMKYSRWAAKYMSHV